MSTSGASFMLEFKSNPPSHFNTKDSQHGFANTLYNGVKRQCIIDSKNSKLIHVFYQTKNHIPLIFEFNFKFYNDDHKCISIRTEGHMNVVDEACVLYDLNHFFL